jgi:ATP-dependent DNA ligase
MLRARTPATTLGTKATFPGFIEPALATAAERRSLVHEIKFDVYRVQVHIMEVKVFTRRGHVLRSENEMPHGHARCRRPSLAPRSW